MTDRFAAQLRQHLLETADDRPVDGQLARVIDGVAATAQRHPLTARRPWSPGRVGLLSSPVVRYGLIAGGLALAAVAGATMAGGARQPSTVFEGTWITIDRADRSGMTLVVGPGSDPAVYFEDGYASDPACVNDEVKRFTARGTGEIADDGLVATYPDGGGCGLMTVETRGVYEHDLGADTLTDQNGLVWTRALGEPPESPAPETPAPSGTPGPEPTPAPEASVAVVTPRPDPDCLQFDAPGTYTAPVGSVSLTVAMPGTVAEPWHGHRGHFDVIRASCTDLMGRGWIDAGEVTLVDTTACTGQRIAVATAAETIAAVSIAKGFDVLEQTEVTLDGYAGTRFDLMAQDVNSPCRNGQFPLLDGVNPIDRGASIRLYLIDVEGTTLALGLLGYPDPVDPAVRRDVDAIIASLRIDP